MIQLKIYSDVKKTDQYWLDLYDTSPIKLTLSIEDITNADATSTFSKAFRVPGTRQNAEFFKNSFDVDGTLYDVTVKKPAEILVDGAEFKQGHIRLQKIILNTQEDRYDYELLFLGETRDFSSIIGDKGLCELDLTDLIGGATPDSFVQPSDIVTSWQAYPQTASITNGLHNGDIIYPLIDHGNTYDEDGDVGESRVAIHSGSTNTPNFTQGYGGGGSNNADPRKTLAIDRIKPMIRAKRIVDQIFEDAGYTYSSDFFESDLFHQIYISAFGNQAVVELTSDNGGGSENTAYGDNQYGTQYATDPLEFQFNQVDPGGNLSNPQSPPYGSIYTVPGPGTYDITARCYYQGGDENSDGSPYYISASLVIYNYVTGIVIATGSLGNGYGSTLSVTAIGASLGAGDKIAIKVVPQNSLYQDLVNNVVFEVTSAPGRYTPSTGLDCQYKQIDFIKDMLTAFRLVLSPDPKDPKNFIVEPWQTYINSGDIYDWSDKLVENKDVVIEPVFFSQSDQIDFKFQPGGDYTNIYHQQAYEQPYGYLEFNSGNDLLKGTREIKLIGIAPTELVNIQGAISLEFVPIPQLHTHSSEDTGLQHLPIKAKTRMLFYNGLQTFQMSGTGASDGWYIQNDPTKRTVYPLVSPYEDWAIQTTSLNLNFANDIQYWGTRVGYNNVGVTLYENYWSRYVSSLYNKYSRRLTANFVLNNIDLNEFSFEDTVFINGTYYRPEKIIDVEVGAYTEVKVQLLTANDYKPTLNLLSDLVVNSITETPAGCFGSTGSILVDTQGTPGFTWALSNGMTGGALGGAAPGNAPYVFTITNVPSGTFNLTITDSLGRTYEQAVTIGTSSTAPPTANVFTQDATDCTAPCNNIGGIIGVSGVGGSGGLYTVVYSDGYTAILPDNRTDLCPGQYDFYIVDSIGCPSVSYLRTITCNQEFPVYRFNLSNEACTQSTITQRYVSLSTPPLSGGVHYNLNDIVTGQDIGGCWAYTGTGTTADATLGQVYDDCNTCNGVPSGNNYIMNNCDVEARLLQTIVDFGLVNPSGTAVYELNGIAGCWQVYQATLSPAGPYTIAGNPYDNCATCISGPPVLVYQVDECHGEQLPWTMSRTFTNPMNPGTPVITNFSVGDVVQFRVGVPGSGATYCGTITALTTGYPDADLASPYTVPDCDDEIHCVQ